MQSRIRTWTAACAMVIALVALTVTTWAQTPEAPVGKALPSETSVVVGTYQPRDAFSAYHLRDAFIDKVRQLQQEMQKAQQNNDSKKMLAIQNQVQDAQSELIRQFTADLDRVMPTVAKQAKVDLVVVDVAFKSPKIKTKDVTALVIEQLNKHAATQPSGKSSPNPTEPGDEKP